MSMNCSDVEVRSLEYNNPSRMLRCLISFGLSRSIKARSRRAAGASILSSCLDAAVNISIDGANEACQRSVMQRETAQPASALRVWFVVVLLKVRHSQHPHVKV